MASMCSAFWPHWLQNSNLDHDAEHHLGELQQLRDVRVERDAPHVHALRVQLLVQVLLVVHLHELPQQLQVRVHLLRRPQELDLGEREDLRTT